MRFPVIVGPTAGGKSALAVETALALEARGLPRGEVVSCDSIQVYKGLDIGSGKATEPERRGVVHHLIDLVEPTETFSVQQWLDHAERTIADICARGSTPIVVGGTHLYIKALLDGLFKGPGSDAALRAQLEAMDPAERRAELERVDPEAAARIHPNDLRRTVRALEVYRLTGTPISAQQRQWDAGGGGRDDCVLVGLEWETDAINRRINDRVRDMIERGLVDEACALWESGRLGPTAREALGYKQLVRHFEGDWSLEEAVEQIKIETRRFAKNQRTWLRRLRATPGSVWIDAGSGGPAEWAQDVVEASFRDV